MIISDTLHYRADGTVSSITRVTRETYTKPSGAEATEDISSTVQLDAVSALLGSAYADMDAHNKSLEAQIVSERATAAAEKAQVEDQLAAASKLASDALRIIEVVRQADANWNAQVAALLSPQ